MFGGFFVCFFIRVVSLMSFQTYCSLGKVYAATPGGGEDRPGTEGYLKMAVVCEGGEKVFPDAAVLLMVVAGFGGVEW